MKKQRIGPLARVKKICDARDRKVAKGERIVKVKKNKKART